MRREKRFPRRGRPETFGWLRLPSHDEGDMVAWERPCGEVILLQPGLQLVQLLPSLAPQPDLAAVRR